MEDDTPMTTTSTTSNNSSDQSGHDHGSSISSSTNVDDVVVELIRNSIVSDNTNFDSTVRGEQLRLDLMYRWMRCRCNAGISTSRPDIALQWFDKLYQYHSEPTRFYHTLMHLEEMFLYLDLLLKTQQQQPCSSFVVKLDPFQEEIIVLSIFFHDAIYNVHSSTNEEDSAVLFQTYMKDLRAAAASTSVLSGGGGGAGGGFDGLEEAVVRCILATKKHDIVSEEEHSRTPALPLFLDLDMAVLGKTSNAYENYAALIRREYSFVPSDQYCEKRSSILEDFLTQQSQIYNTRIMLLALEQRARDNIQKEIDTLRRGNIPRIKTKS